MTNFQKIAPKSIIDNPFKLIGDDWTLITAGEKSKFNTMTASWGGLGVLWNKPVATIYIRPQRYTLEFVEKNDYFTLSFFGDEYKKQLTFCGRNSGRDCDKMKETKFTPIEIENSISFDEAKLILVCKKLYHTEINPENFYDNTIDTQNYPNMDYHKMFIAEIVSVYTK